MNRDQALDKIKKCLELAKSSEAHEASAALRQAQKLMAEFQIGDQDVKLSVVCEAFVEATTTALPAWEATLAGIVAEAFGCELFTSSGARRNGAGRLVLIRRFVFVGVEPVHEVAAYAFQVLQRQCKRARSHHISEQPKNCKPITKTARGDAFALGWAQGVRELVERFAGSPASRELLDAYMQQHYPDMGSAKVQRKDLGRNVRNDQALGRHAAETASLNRGVGGPLARHLITR